MNPALDRHWKNLEDQFVSKAPAAEPSGGVSHPGKIKSARKRFPV